LPLYFFLKIWDISRENVQLNCKSWFSWIFNFFRVAYFGNISLDMPLVLKKRIKTRGQDWACKMRERVCRSREKTWLQKIRPRKTYAQCTKLLKKKSCSIMYLFFKFLFSMKTRKVERVTCSLDSHFFQVECSSNQFIRNVREKSKEKIADKLHSCRTDYSQVTQRWAKRGHAYRDYARGRLIDILLASLTAHAWPRETHIHTHASSISLSEN